MNQSEEIKKIKLEFEKFKQEVNIWSTKIAMIIENVTLAIDKQRPKFIKFNNRIW